MYSLIAIVRQSLADVRFAAVSGQIADVPIGPVGAKKGKSREGDITAMTTRRATSSVMTLNPRAAGRSISGRSLRPLPWFPLLTLPLHLGNTF